MKGARPKRRSKKQSQSVGVYKEMTPQVGKKATLAGSPCTVAQGAAKEANHTEWGTRAT